MKCSPSSELDLEVSVQNPFHVWIVYEGQIIACHSFIHDVLWWRCWRSHKDRDFCMTELAAGEWWWRITHAFLSLTSSPVFLHSNKMIHQKMTLNLHYANIIWKVSAVCLYCSICSILVVWQSWDSNPEPSDRRGISLTTRVCLCFFHQSRVLRAIYLLCCCRHFYSSEKTLYWCEDLIVFMCGIDVRWFNLKLICTLGLGDLA